MQEHLQSWMAFLALGSVLDEKLERRDYRLFRRCEVESLVSRLLESMGKPSLVEPSVPQSSSTSPMTLINANLLLRIDNAFPFLTKSREIPLLAKAAIAVLAFRSIEKRDKVYIYDLSPLFKVLEIPINQWNREGHLLLEYCQSEGAYLRAERLEAKEEEELSPVLSLTSPAVENILGIEAPLLYRKREKKGEGKKNETLKNHELKVPQVTLKDVVLPEEVRMRIEYLVKSSKKSSKPKFNLLLYGAPGTGKTFTATAIAGELKSKLITADIAKIHSAFVGDTEKAITKMFDEAEKNSAILFFDEADTMVRERNLTNRSWEISETCHLLRLIEESPVSVILATNHIEIVDSALLRRLNEVIEFPIPDKRARALIWKKEVSRYRFRVGEEELNSLSEIELSGGLITAAARKAQMLKASQGRKLLVDGSFLKSIAHGELRKMGKEFIQGGKRRIGF